MAVCPVCHNQGELGQECPQDHRHYVDENSLAKHPDDALLGSLIGGQYVPLALIGEGGMGRIYRAKAKYTGKIVALKILKSEYMEDETLKERFFREAEVVAALEHPNIVKLYSCAPDPTFNTIFMAMELLTGHTLFDILNRNVPDLNTMVRWFIEISSALGEAHKNGIFHRDLKPENIIIEKDDNGESHAKVLDFGFARLQSASKKLTMAGVAFGTPHYMSPEQAMGLTDITGGVDVYALGIMLFQVISGHLPFGQKTSAPMEVMRSQVYDPVPDCIPRPEYKNVPNELISCIYKCMNKDPKDRFPDGRMLHEALVAIAEKMNGGVSSSARKAASAPAPVAPAAPATKKPSNAPLQTAGQDEESALSLTNKILIGVLILLVIIVIIVLLQML